MTDENRELPAAGLNRSMPGTQAHAFVPRSNWAGNVTFRAARIHKPHSVDDLSRIVAGSRRIRALGSGHSFSTIADTTDDLVVVNELPQSVVVNSATLTATVPSGMSYTVLSEHLHRAGFALANLASIPHISIAGACATGTHGSGNDQRVLAAAVSGLQLVGSDGDVVELQRDVNRDTFRGSVVALGALGIVTQLQLDIEPAYEMRQWVHLGIPLDEVGDRLDEVFSAGYSVSAFTDWLSGEAAVWVKCRADEPRSKWAAGRPAEDALHPVPGMSPHLCTEQLGIEGPWHERLPHFRPTSGSGNGNELQSEVFLPRGSAQEAIAALRGISRLSPFILPGQATPEPFGLLSSPSRSASCRWAPGHTGARSRVWTRTRSPPLTSARPILNG